MPLCSTLVVRQGKPEEVVGDLIKQLDSVTAVAFHEEVRFREATHSAESCECTSSVFLVFNCQFPEGGVRGKDCGEEAKGHLLPKQSQSSDFLGVYTLPQR